MRTALVRGGVLAALAAAPLSLAVSAVSALGTAAAPAAAPAAPNVIAPPTGYAESFVDLWLRSSAEDTVTSETLRTMAPGVDLPRPRSTARLIVQKTIAVRSQPMGGRTWQVTVAASVVVPPSVSQSARPSSSPAQGGAQGAQGRGADSGTAEVRYFSVQVSMTRATGSGGSPDALVVTSAPAQVAPPAALADRDPAVAAYGAQVSEGPLRETVAGYLTAYLTGVGDSTRYLAPGTRIPVPGAAYTQVALKDLSATTTVPSSPADGTVIQAEASVQAQDALGEWPLSYPLRLTARAGRWEISAIAPVSAAPAPASSTTSSLSSPSSIPTGAPVPAPSTSSNGARP
ncbi:hypothetical protein ACFY00_25070 [Kitasatospora sp. NPDC001540]|uniref:hypothetical protein n=1 Tax=Kitasatospora sp. NPDC001540 TaxID=3364014 RepID=UPI00368F1619